MSDELNLLPEGKGKRHGRPFPKGEAHHNFGEKGFALAKQGQAARKLKIEARAAARAVKAAFEGKLQTVQFVKKRGNRIKIEVPRRNVRNPTGKGCIPAKAGEVRNPLGINGSRGIKTLTAAYTARLSDPCTLPEFIDSGYTWAEVVAAGMCNRARDDARSAQELREATEGKALARSEISGPGGAPLVPLQPPTLNVHFVDSPLTSDCHSVAVPPPKPKSDEPTFDGPPGKGE